MKVGEFLSSTGVRPTSTDPDAENFNKLKAFMSQAKTVQQWNLLRDCAKADTVFAKLIGRLDTSGFIFTLNLINEAR